MSPIDVAETVFPAVPESVGGARRFTGAALRRHFIPPETIDVAILLVSELATNAIVHATGEIRVRVNVDDEDTVRVEVYDASEDAPTLMSAAAEDDCGRGLSIVADLADGWDWAPRSNGKVVWFALAHR